MKERILRIVDGRTVAIILPGCSLAILERSIPLLQKDYCWCGLNKFWVAESLILQRIHKEFSLLFGVADHFFDQRFERLFVQKFLPRESDNLFITKKQNGYRIADELLEKYPDKVVLADKTLKGGNSLQNLLVMLDEIGIKKVVLFGADGYSDTDEAYYRADLYFNLDFNRLSNGHKRDTTEFNKIFPKLGMQVLNCSPDSHYDVFEKITFKQLLRSEV